MISKKHSNEMYMFFIEGDNFSISNQNTKLWPTISEVKRLRSFCNEYLGEMTDFEIDKLNKNIKQDWEKEINESKNNNFNEEKVPTIGNVYLMKNERNGHIKIGFTTKEPKIREATLQSQEPEVVLLNYWIGGFKDEQSLHNIFKDQRVRGEWFSLTDSDIKKITNYFSIA